MKLIQKLILASACTLLSTIAFAHDFSTVTRDGKIFFFNVINAQNREVELTYEGSITSPVASRYIGELTIPQSVTYNGDYYTVVGIGAKAFSNATQLTGVTLPSQIRSIGSFAFEKCLNLESVVFSGSIKSLGEGIFFDCPSISQVSLGSDWLAINLKMFMWSNKLEVINIGPKVSKIQNLKSLHSLKVINVDVNNPNFSTVNGMLYSKDRSTLLGCPRAYEGALKVVEGCTSVYYGALIDCPYITSVELPSTLTRLSYLEFSRMSYLSTIFMHNPTPIATAVCDGDPVFALRVNTQEAVNIVVPRASLSQYTSCIVSSAGEYIALADISPNTSNLPKVARKGELVTKKQIFSSVPTKKKKNR